jgi:CRISPR type I-E-associated protein CasB/Cse2
MSRTSARDTFLHALRALDPPNEPVRTDRATLARLRRGIAKPEFETLMTCGWLFDELDDDDVSNGILLAGLFAWHSQAHGQGSMGKSLAHYRSKVGESADKHFVQLVDSTREDLATRLRHAVRLLASKDIPVDWKLLFTHLIAWNSDDRWVQWHWSRDYWVGRGRPANSEEAAAVSSESISPEPQGD